MLTEGCYKVILINIDKDTMLLLKTGEQNA